MGIFDKFKEKAKVLAEKTKATIQAATAQTPPPELTERQSELVENFGYTVWM